MENMSWEQEGNPTPQRHRLENTLSFLRDSLGKHVDTVPIDGLARDLATIDGREFDALPDEDKAGYTHQALMNIYMPDPGPLPIDPDELLRGGGTG